jgi:hypothetical protein
MRLDRLQGVVREKSNSVATRNAQSSQHGGQTAAANQKLCVIDSTAPCAHSDPITKVLTASLQESDRRQSGMAVRLYHSDLFDFTIWN